MQFSMILPIALCLAASTLANPLALPKNHHGGAGAGAATGVSAQVKANVSAQIDKWLGDIETVNNFVDTVGSVTDLAVISSMAATAFIAAQNEGASNTILRQDVTLDACGAAAAQALVGKFNIIGPAINDTISNPGNLQKNLDAINGARYSYLI
jgi:intracellular sulfur oxidation DsrE/DsrF family protein